MINACRQDDQIILDKLDANPLVALVAHVKVPGTIANVPDLLVLVQVLVEELAHLRLVDGPHLLGRDDDLVPVLVAALRRQGVYALDIWEPEVKDADLFKLRDCHFLAGVVGEALVTLIFVSNG